jgi:PTH1 family peptidyl-tRNA hydrolase
MRLLVGLGNPGQKYARNRHNIGFMAVDAIARGFGFSVYRSRFRGLLAEGEIASQKVLLLKPETYMNLSGTSVAEAANFYKIALEDVIVFHDELALEFAKVRVKTGGGAAGHNGLKSIDAHLGNGYRRVRIGIDHPGDKRLVSPYVLSDFFAEEVPVMETLIDTMAQATPALIEGDPSSFMNRIALAVRAAQET